MVKVSGEKGRGARVCQLFGRGRLQTYKFTNVGHAKSTVDEDPDMYFGVFDDDSHLVAMSPTFEGAQFLAQQKGLDANYMNQDRLQKLYHSQVRKFGG